MSACYLHARRPADAACDGCRRPVCDRCLTFEGHRPICPACVGGVRMRARVARWGGRLAVAALVLGLGAGAAMWVRSLPREVAPDPAAVVAALVRAGDEALAVDAWDTAERAFAQALALAPDDLTVQGRLGLLYFARGADGEARRHLERARVLGSDDPAITLALDQMDAADQADRESARAARRQAEASAARAQARRAEAEAEAAAAAAAAAVPEPPATPAAAAPAGACEIPLRRGLGGSVLLDLRVEGADTLFILDTGATMTSITTDLVERLGLAVDPEQTISARTAGGRVEMGLARLREVSIAGATVRDLPVAVCPGCDLDGAEGLLGLDVQRALHMEVDLAGGRVRLAGCE